MADARKIYTVVVAGLGKRGMHHALAFAANPRFRVVGLYNRGEERLNAAREKFADAIASGDLSDVLGDMLEEHVYDLARTFVPAPWSIHEAARSGTAEGRGSSFSTVKEIVTSFLRSGHPVP